MNETESNTFFSAREAAEWLQVPSMSFNAKLRMIRRMVNSGELLLSSRHPMLIRKDVLVQAFSPRSNNEIRLSRPINQEKHRKAKEYIDGIRNRGRSAISER